MYRVCIIIPFYNEEARFDSSNVVRFIEEHDNYLFCLVNDGSSDSTLLMLNDLQSKYSPVKVVNLEQNRGKAEAIRQGMLEVLKCDQFEYVAFLDADFSAPIGVIPFMLDSHPDISLYLGARIKYLGVNIFRDSFRHYVGRVFATLASGILNLPIYDTQCGAKIFKRDLVEVAFSEPFISSWLFDLEVIMRIVKKLGWNNFCQISREIPLYEWIEKGGSKVKMSYMFKLPIDLLKVRRKYGKVNFQE